MAVRGRPTSSTAEDTVESLSDKTSIPIPGDRDTRDNRIAGMGPLTGLIAGVGIGAILGACRAAGWRPGLVVAGLAATVGALIGTNGPMTALGVADPRSWSTSAWITDIVPHLAYGAVTAAVLSELDQN